MKKVKTFRIFAHLVNEAPMTKPTPTKESKNQMIEVAGVWTQPVQAAG